MERVLAVLDGVEQRADVGEIGVGAGGGELAGIDRQGERNEAVGVGLDGRASERLPTGGLAAGAAIRTDLALVVLTMS